MTSGRTRTATRDIRIQESRKWVTAVPAGTAWRSTNRTDQRKAGNDCDDAAEVADCTRSTVVALIGRRAETLSVFVDWLKICDSAACARTTKPRCLRVVVSVSRGSDHGRQCHPADHQPTFFRVRNCGGIFTGRRRLHLHFGVG